MKYTVQLDFFIDEDETMTEKEVKDVLGEIFDCYNCSVSNINLIKVSE